MSILDRNDSTPGSTRDDSLDAAADGRTGLSRRSMMAGGAVLAAGAGLSGCGGSAALDGKTQLDYWLWDANQLPAYSDAIDMFMEQNPDIDVRITQMGWGDYWTKLTASFVAEAGPDCFTDHLGRYPEFLKLGVIAPLDGLAALEDVTADRFQDGLQTLWTAEDGTRYGIPKDYDTIALLYDRGVLEEAGLTDADLVGLDWNPEDGGSFERILARLTVDTQGVRGDEDGFDPSSVATYGMAAPTSIDYVGQSAWSAFALSTGWTFCDEPTWGRTMNYDDERFQTTIDWYFGLVEKGFFPAYGVFGQSSPEEVQIQSGSSALALAGSWMIGTYSRLDGVDLGIAPLPAGPVGTPVSMFNGLGDSISAQSQNKEEAARLIAFLATEEAQKVIGGFAAFFPATDVGTEAAIAAHQEAGLDVTPFTDRVKEDQTGLYPLVENSASIASVMQTAFDKAWLGEISGEDFSAYNERVNALFE